MALNMIPTAMITDKYCLTSESLRCFHCGNKSPMHIICSGSGIEDYVDSKYRGLFANHRWQVLMCPSCQRVNVVQFTEFAGEEYLRGIVDGEEVWEQPVTTYVLYPSKDPNLPEPHPDMPSAVREDYEEAREIFSRSTRSSAALLRLALQKLCVELGEKGRNLNADIANLVKRGLPAHIQQALDIVRVIGNEAVHPGVIDVRDNPEVARGLFGLINEVVGNQIGEAKRRAKIESEYDSLPKSKRDAIVKRDQRNGAS